MKPVQKLVQNSTMAYDVSSNAFTDTEIAGNDYRSRSEIEHTEVLRR